MKFFKEKTDTVYLFDTPVENIFINEYMPMAPDNYVKVYLLAKMYMTGQEEKTTEDIAKTLAISPQEVEKAILYWDQAGLITRNAQGITFVSLKEKLYGKPRSRRSTNSRGKELLDNKRLREIVEQLQQITGTYLTGNDAMEVTDWLDQLKASPQVIIGAAKYCADRGKTNIRYIGSVVADWTGRGLATEVDVERHLQQSDEKHYIFRRVMKALGFHRDATEEEQRIISGWVDDMGCSVAEILEACSKTSGISNPNINYVNKVLQGKRGISAESGKVNNTIIKDYYAWLRNRAEDEAADRKRELAARIPRLDEIGKALIDCSAQITQAMIAGGTDKLEQLESVKERITALERERDALMTENNIPIDYANVRYLCPLCEDTGILSDGRRCSCYVQRVKEAGEWYQQQRKK